MENKKSERWLRPRRMPTWRLWLVICLGLTALLGTVGYNTHAWLSLNNPVPDAPYYVVEGWMPDYAVIEGGRHFSDSENRKLVLTSGGPLDRGALFTEYKDFATLAAYTLAKSDVPDKQILPCPSVHQKRERTRVMAEHVKAQLELLNIPAEQKRINIVSLGVHSRRSRRVYADVLGPDWQVGVHCVTDADYDPEQWWKTSEGARSALTELVALTVNRK
jgi:hypothetical protein